tara:strand:- start:1585 stop:1929 length:345 start_codon:yes stop_codon:yes gene_type:complete
MRQTKSKILIEEFLNIKNYECVNFFRTTHYGYLILLYIHYYQENKENLSLVKLTELIPRRIASNLTILNTVKVAHESGFLIKESNDLDRREISIKFSKICFNEVNTWLESINLK